MMTTRADVLKNLVVLVTLVILILGCFGIGRIAMTIQFMPLRLLITLQVAAILAFLLFAMPIAFGELWDTWKRYRQAAKETHYDRR